MSQQGDGLVPAPVLEDGIVRLRPWATTDLACVKAASDEGVIPESMTVPHSYTERGGREWIERQHSRVIQGQGWSLANTEMPQGPAVGCGVLLLRPQEEGVAGIGYWLVPSARGRGLASRAVALLTEWGFREPRFALSKLGSNLATRHRKPSYPGAGTSTRGASGTSCRSQLTVRTLWSSPASGQHESVGSIATSPWHRATRRSEGRYSVPMPAKNAE